MAGYPTPIQATAFADGATAILAGISTTTQIGRYMFDRSFVVSDVGGRETGSEKYGPRKRIDEYLLHNSRF
ncbi:hypothetical protein ACDY97_30300 [Rhizobium mongolense]|uniref:hypothetical protein n=1 Tax=Rhizobium mongolense TaxID=57676 RepID=UPI00355685AC